MPVRIGTDNCDSRRSRLIDGRVRPVTHIIYLFSFGSSQVMFPDFYSLGKFRVKKFDGHNDEVNCVAFSSDFNIMVTGSDDNNVRIFNTDNCRLIHHVTGHDGAVRCVAISTNGEYFASGSYDKTVQIRRTKDASLCHALKGHSKSVEVVMFSPDVKTLCSGSWDRTAFLWNILTGSIIVRLVGHGGLVQSLAFSPQGVSIATGSWDFLVRVWSLDDYCQTEVDQQMSNGDQGCCKKDGDCQKAMSQQMNPPKPSYVLKKHTGNVHAVSFSNSDLLASGSWDKTVCLWNLSNGQLLHCLTGHEGWVQTLSFSQDGSYIVSASEDDTIRIWNILNGQCQKVLAAKTEDIRHCAFTSDGRIITSGTDNISYFSFF